MPDPHERHRTLALRWFQEVWNQRRAETIDEMMSRDFVGRLETAPDATFDDFKASHTMLLGAIPDFHVEVLQTVADNGGVAIRWRVTGTHTGSAFGFPPSGKKVDFVGLTWLRFEDDMLVEGWDSWNAGVVFQRLRRARESEIEKRHGLTPRQAQVALLMADRRSTKEIARELEIRPNTARRHCQAVLRRLGVHTRKQVKRVLQAVPHDE